MLALFRSERDQSPEAALIAFSPCRDAFVQPYGLSLDLALQFVAFAVAALDKTVAPRFEFGEAALDAVGRAVEQPHRGARQVFEKAPIVAD